MAIAVGDLRQPKASAPPDDADAASGTQQESRPSGTIVILAMFLATLICPPEVRLDIAGLNLPLYRLFLLVLAPYCVFTHFVGGGNPTKADFLILAMCVWIAISLMVVSGLGRWQFIGLSVLEVAAPYFFARRYVRTIGDLRQFYKVYLVVIIVILPVAIFESVSGQLIVRDIARAVFGAHGIPAVPRAPRLGLDRATVSFEHPIHYGVFVASAMAILFYSARAFLTRAMRGAVVAVGTFFSLSSGALIILVVQLYMIGWDIVFSCIEHCLLSK